LRASPIAIAAILLAACDSGTVPPPGQQSQVDDGPPVASNEVVLRGDGLTAGVESFYFSAGENEVRGALETTLGAEQSVAQNKECGAGPMSFVGYPGGLTANFQESRLVGWNIADRSEAIGVVGDLVIGTPRQDAVTTDGFVALEPTTLGEEFALGSEIGGFIDNDMVVMLYAGSQCFFR